MASKKCCRNCKNLAEIPKKNNYGDINHFCLITGYFVSSIDKDTTKVERYSPGGKKLNCKWEEKEK